MSILRFSKKNTHENIKNKAKADIETSRSKPQADAEKDLHRCGDLLFQTPTGEILTAPNNTNDTDNGKKRLQWLIEQIQTYHKGSEEEKNAIINHIKQYAHQEGFLCAGRNGVDTIMHSKGIFRDLESDTIKVSSAFSLRNNEFSYIERYDLPMAFTQHSDDGTITNLTASVSPASLIMRSVMVFNPTNQDKPITQKIESLDITIRDELALNIFADRTDTNSKKLEKEKNLKEFTKPSFFSRLIESISSLFQRANKNSSNKPKL